MTLFCYEEPYKNRDIDWLKPELVLTYVWSFFEDKVS